MTKEELRTELNKFYDYFKSHRISENIINNYVDNELKDRWKKSKVRRL